ncbi:hypothetical protein [Mycolicibacter kumamotonensis]|jgi:hypothetical protein|uniref:Uncharacterized protein n=1 Tax=Mycolicibacter kumamotonensis TaxID=354243 RepID=A0A1X0E942_9MYCO|nr:hypothetical protein [Mycolicibacter kumamotonensis]NDJ87652.1 hypothetical protein [Mycolicibacter kumamotonensis]ORA81102.1 hypothetical protein BST28_08065 [Mycolicibacter kumamotonensis]
MNALIARARAALRSGAGPVVALLFAAALSGSAGLCVAVLVLAALGFVGYLLAPWIDQQRAVIERRHEGLRERADRQHRWALHGDSRGLYGVDGAELMRRLAADANPADDPSGDGDEEPRIAAVAYTPEGLDALLAERPACWRYAVFVSVLVQRYGVLQARLRDQQLGYAPHRGPRIHTDFQLGQHLFELLDQMSTLVSQVEELMLSPSFTRMFGDPTDETTADAEAIMHAAHRLMDLHERLLSLAERCRGVNAPGEHADIVRDCARVLDVPLEGYRRFIDEFVVRVGELPDVLPYARGTIAMDPVMLEMADDDGVLDKAFAGLATLAPHAH